jgi:hypothetical protein
MQPHSSTIFVVCNTTKRHLNNGPPGTRVKLIAMGLALQKTRETSAPARGHRAGLSGCVIMGFLGHYLITRRLS